MSFLNFTRIIIMCLFDFMAACIYDVTFMRRVLMLQNLEIDFSYIIAHFNRRIRKADY